MTSARCRPEENSVPNLCNSGDKRIMGVMIESHLKAGQQSVIEGRPLVYGQSITDACLSWEDTLPLLKNLANAVQKRRSVKI
jgi:3-deoxy-7-phosphoheptulonate synthase